MTAHPHRLQRHDLLRVALNAKFRRQGGTRLPHKHQRSQHRRHFPHQAERNQRPQQTFRTKAIEDIVTLQPQHQTCKHAHDQDHRQTERALFINSAGDPPGQPSGFHRRTERRPGK